MTQAALTQGQGHTLTQRPRWRDDQPYAALKAELQHGRVEGEKLKSPHLALRLPPAYPFWDAGTLRPSHTAGGLPDLGLVIAHCR